MKRPHHQTDSINETSAHAARGSRLVRFFRLTLLSLLGLILLSASYWIYQHFIRPLIYPTPPIVVTPPQPPIIPPITQPPKLKPELPKHVAKLIDSVFKQVEITRSYDPAYVNLKYPGGDVPLNTGVCADVVIRAFRAQGLDLQKLVHDDMQQNFSIYPKKWGLKRTDTNIDHRRVPNLMKFFERQGKALPTTQNPDDYQAGDIVAWDLGTGQNHIGIVLHFKTDDGARPLMGHNVGEGTSIEDVLFAWPIVGHYRYFTPNSTQH